MAGWLTLMLVIAVAGREATRELAVFQVMEMRSLIGLLLMWPLVRAAGGLAALKTQRLRDHATRNTVHYAAQYAWFAALTMIPLAQVVAIEFTMPIWIILLAAAFLGERITRWKVLAVALGLCGVALIVRPSASGLSPGQLVALAAALGFAVSVTMVKSLTGTDSALAIIFWMLVRAVAAGPAAGAVGVALAFARRLGLGAGGGLLRHLLALLHGPRDAPCRCHRGDADGLPARAAHRTGRLADLCRAAGPVHRGRHRADPGRQPAQPAPRRGAVEGGTACRARLITTLPLPPPTMNAPTRMTRLLCSSGVVLCLAACAGGEVGGTLSGLGSGLSVTLLNNGSDPLTLSSNGSFAFVDALEANAAYAVTVRTQPVGQTCSVSSGSGTIDADGTSIDSVRVDCAFAASLRGTVTGLLPGTALTLVNDGNPLAITADGAFAFSQTLTDGTAYNVSVQVQPVGATCAVQNGSGTFVAATFKDIVVSCS